MIEGMVQAESITETEASKKESGLMTCLMVKASKSMQRDSPPMKVSLKMEINYILLASLLLDSVSSKTPLSVEIKKKF